MADSNAVEDSREPNAPSSTLPATTEAFSQQRNDTPQQPSAGKSKSTAAGPSAMSLQRVLSTPRQPTGSINGVMEGTRDRLTTNGTTSPSWPTSPRLRSPPPSANHTSARKDSSDQTQSNTAKRLVPVAAPELAAAMLLSDGAKDVPQSPSQSSSSHLRVPPRNATATAQNTGLETVVEGSVPSTPSLDLKMDPMAQVTGLEGEKRAEISNPGSSTNLSESSRNTPRPEIEPKSRPPTITKPITSSNLAKRSFPSLTGSKKPAAEPMRTMTVETEQVCTTTSGIGDRSRDGGSVRTKTSTETIRPRKEKKKTTRKTNTLYAGMPASKADIFEAKVASAVDEADSDDSEETFVYESNPPDTRSYRHHSRTPSATSLASTHDYRNNKHNRGTRTANSTPRHHQIGRYGRNNHPSLFDNESPFGQHRQASDMQQISRPNSSRVSNARVTSPRKHGASAYDYNEDIADDERAPLMGTVRVTRNRHSRRPHSRDFRSLELGEEPEGRCWTTCTAWLFLTALVIFIIGGVGTFVVAVNRPLFDVEIRRITNVLASEQELMLDLDVKAVNPNLFAVIVTDLDVNLFAESPYVGTNTDWHQQHPGSGLRLGISERRKRGWFWPDPPAHPSDGVDEGTDPDDPEGGQKMLLGRVFEFDSPLTFEPDPMRRSVSSSVGEIRLTKPGNKTEIGGSQRWERVLLHDFELIVRGVIKYQLPLSAKVRSAKISGRKTIHPDSEDDKKLARPRG